MVWAGIIVTLLSHIFLPLFLIFKTATSKASSMVPWTSLWLLSLGYFLMMSLGGGGWHWLGFYWNYVLLALFVAATAFFLRKNPTLPWTMPSTARAWTGLIVLALLALFFLSTLPSFMARRDFEQSKALALSWPLEKGTYYIVHGGHGIAVNHHAEVPAQTYALDITKLGAFGVRAAGLWPSDLAHYTIYGEKVLAPCNGEVLDVRDGMDDLIPPDTDGAEAAGNYVALFCGQHSVMMGHLKKGSVLVTSGDKVARGQALGAVGNSGNTSEPHLHIHAVLGRQEDHADLGWKAEGVPMLFGDRFLVRTDTFSP